MRRFAFLFVAIGLVGWSLTTVIGGCGADEETADVADATPESGPLRPGTSSSGSTGTNSSGSSSGSSGPPPCFPDACAPDGGALPGLAPNPGMITCGASECDAGNGGVCCVRDGGSDIACSRFFCGGPALEISCDETADCPKGGQQQRQRLCCYDQNTTFCAPDCNDNPQVCKTDAECGDAGPCNVKSCGTRGHVLHVCGSPEGCK